MENYVAKVKELATDKAFVEELFTKQTAEEAQAFFADKGVDLSLDDVKEMGSVLEKVVKGEVTSEQLEAAANGELTEDELEEAAGGCGGLATCALVFGVAVVTTGSVSAAVTAAVKYKDEICNWFRSW